MSDQRLVITGLGMVSSIGNDWAQSCTAYHAGINQFMEYEDFFPENEELDFSDPAPLIGARAPYFNTDMESNRAPRLALPALQELIHSSNIERDLFDKLDLLVTVATGPRLKTEAEITNEFTDKILNVSKNATGIRERIKAAHTGFPALLSIAQEKVLKENKQCFVLVTIDSYHYPETLEALDENKRIKSKRAKDGFIPGEAAVAVLVETVEHAVNRKAKIKAYIESIAHAREENTIFSDKPSSGNGLVTAIKNVCSAANNYSPEWVLCDLNGESYRAYEWGMAQVKLSNEFNKLKTVWHPADCFGDVGSSSGAVMMAVAIHAFEKGYAPSQRALIFCSEDDGKRAAFVIKSAKS
ncbi:MAG: hypothetical protein KAU21_02800 [Gammaproteobacteria bacterium]|nr:hypothetical protein [Gammaproteobacteria bacterium]